MNIKNINIKKTAFKIFVPVIFLIVISVLLINSSFFNEYSSSDRINQIIERPGLIAFWDFSNRNENGWSSYYDKNIVDYSYNVVLRRIGDHTSYTPDNWPYTDENSKLIYDASGPFGNAVRFNKGYIFAEVPRSEFDQTPLDIYGRQPFTLIAWCKFIGDRHFVTGIWDEGGWDKYRGRRQFALFGGILGDGTVGHISTTGAASYPQSTLEGSQYARKGAVDGQDFDNGQWVAMAMTFDPKTDRVKAYLDGISTHTHITDVVAMDILKHGQLVSSNPFYFPWPVYSPRLFTIKFNGYDVESTGVYEHWLNVDIESSRITYRRNDIPMATNDQVYQIYFDILRNNKSILSNPIVFMGQDENNVDLPKSLTIKPGDEINTSLYRQKNDTWIQVGSEINYLIREGAPFTFGRALGFGDDPIDVGTQLYIDGVAIFNRVLKSKELQKLSFN